MRTFVVLALALVACGDGSNSDPGTDAQTVDARLNPLVGEWERQVFTDFDRTTAVDFTDQGVLRWGDNLGSWNITFNGKLKAGAPPALPMDTAPFYLSPDHTKLMMAAMLPTTPTDGLVGTWEGDYEFSDGTFMTQKFVFRADQTVEWAQTTYGSTRNSVGTWTLEEDANVIIDGVLDGTTPVTFTVRLIPDVAIGSHLLYRSE